MIKVAIIGGAGYTAGELIRILINHPQATISSIVSQSHAGHAVAAVHQDLVGETDLVFDSAIKSPVDVAFLCVGHGRAAQYLEENPLPAQVKVIDLGNDFRHKADAQFKGRNFVYGLPELNKAAIINAENIANPGCFATTIQLALLPLAKEGLLTAAVHINAITGSTGAGQAPSDTTHFSWREGNVSIYKAFEHQHLTEITESIQQLQVGFDHSLHWIPMRGNFTRGIFATLYTKTTKSLEEIISLYKTYYKDAAFTFVADSPLHMKQVVNTNKCLLHLEKHGDQLLITSITDNLIKGASGQAIQNMNLMFDLDEKAGLHLKANLF